MTRVYLDDNCEFFHFTYGNVDYRVRVVGHEFTMESVDALEKRLEEITGSKEYPIESDGYPTY